MVDAGAYACELAAVSESSPRRRALPLGVGLWHCGNTTVTVLPC